MSSKTSEYRHSYYMRRKANEGAPLRGMTASQEQRLIAAANADVVYRSDRFNYASDTDAKRHSRQYSDEDFETVSAEIIADVAQRNGIKVDYNRASGKVYVGDVSIEGDAYAHATIDVRENAKTRDTSRMWFTDEWQDRGVPFKIASVKETRRFSTPQEALRYAQQVNKKKRG